MEDVRGTSSAPGREEADMKNTVRLFNRPDIKGTAYYEFAVTVDSNEAGFILVTSGDFDYPISHWNFQGPSITKQLDDIAKESIATYYKLDALTYVGEDLQGDMVAHIGSLPPTMDHISMGKSLDILEVRQRGAKRQTGYGYRLKSYDIDTEKPIQFSDIKKKRPVSWATSKRRYKTSFEIDIESLKKDAANDWEVEREIYCSR